MATVRKAKSWLIYGLALFISGVFSLIGRHAPAWADEVKFSHDSKVFQEAFRVAADSDNRRVVVGGQDTENQRLIGVRDMNTRFTTVSPRLTDFQRFTDIVGSNWQVTPQIESQFGTEFNTTVKEVLKKAVESPNDLTAGELSLIQSLDNALKLQNIEYQLKTIENSNKGR